MKIGLHIFVHVLRRRSDFFVRMCLLCFVVVLVFGLRLALFAATIVSVVVCVSLV